jgi:hypothetical protein
MIAQIEGRGLFHVAMPKVTVQMVRSVLGIPPMRPLALNPLTLPEVKRVKAGGGQVLFLRMPIRK